MSDSPIYAALRHALFCVDAERAHEGALAFLKASQSAPGALSAMRMAFARNDPRLQRTVWGIEFPNPVGLAAGFDKNGAIVHAMAALGFGFVEVGTVTPRPQAGNPRPRLFRLSRDRSLQNALGFNNEGMERVRTNLERGHPYAVPVGVNLGKNKDTSEAGAAEDYVRVLECLVELGDYFVVNLSSPNTPGLRALQSEAFIAPLLTRLKSITSKPVLVKLSPDEAPDRLVALAQSAVNAGAAGIVATNTTVDYALSKDARESGGISGRLLRAKSEAALREIAGAVDVPLIGVGGIDSAEAARARLDAGASLIQLYTGLIYEGPSLPGRINAALAR